MAAPQMTNCADVHSFLNDATKCRLSFTHARATINAIDQSAMSVMTENIFSSVPTSLVGEHITRLLTSPNVTIERIVSSQQHASPEGLWYDQDRDEWVIVLAGSAGLLFEGEREPRVLAAGDHVHIPAHARHRVAWTDPTQPTIWLAVHYCGTSP